MQDTSREHIPIHDYKLGTINSASGDTVDLRYPWKSKMHIEDIAIGLSNICRFGGQIKNAYTVAQHSIYVMHLAHDSIKKEALMHDAAEAYIGDVIKPLKHILGEAYSNIEGRFMMAICDQYGLDPYKLEEVKKYDLDALELENEALKKGNPFPLVFSMNLHGMFETQAHFIWDSLTARVAFFQEYEKLFK